MATVGYKELKKAGVFLVPGFAKFVVIKKPATKARKGTNPFTGEPMTFKAKPARKIVRARPVKAAKDAVQASKGPTRDLLPSSAGRRAQGSARGPGIDGGWTRPSIDLAGPAAAEGRAERGLADLVRAAQRQRSLRTSTVRGHLYAAI